MKQDRKNVCVVFFLDKQYKGLFLALFGKRL